MKEATAKQYLRRIEFWLEYCRRRGVHHLDGSPLNLTLFVSYLIRFTAKTHGVCQAILTAVRHYFDSFGVVFVRPTAMNKALRGLRSMRPSKTYPRKPLGMAHLLKLRSKGICGQPTDEWSSYLFWVTLVSHYMWGLRGGEGCPSVSRDSPHVVQRSQLTFQRGDDGHCHSAILDLPKHKGDKYGERDAHVPVFCECGDRSSICGVHLMLEFVEHWDRRFGRYGDGPLFRREDGSALPRHSFQHQIQCAIAELNVLCGLNLDVAQYKPHSMRAGSCTDKCAAGIDPHFIKRWGRWVSDAWDTSYVKLDLTELAILSSCSLARLGLAGSTLSMIAQRNAARNAANPTTVSRLSERNIARFNASNLGSSSSSRRRCSYTANSRSSASWEPPAGASLSSFDDDSSSCYAPRQRAGRQMRSSRISMIPTPNRARLESIAESFATDEASSSASHCRPIFERNEIRQRAIDAIPRNASGPITRSRSRATKRRRR